MTKPNSENPDLTTRTKEFLENVAKMNKPPLYEMKPEEAREFLKEVQKNYTQDIDAQITDTELFTPIADNVPVRIVRPAGNHEKLPVILYIHGGGWVMGDKYTHDAIIKKLANCTKSVVVFPEYTLSPEVVYPYAFTQIYAVLDFIFNNPDQFNIDSSRIAIAGDSAGGNMAAAIALKSKNENGPKIKFQALFYPVTDAKMQSESYNEFAEGPWLTKKAMEYFWDAYLTEKDLAEDPYVSPLYASLEDLKELPPTLIITDENDVLRDEGEEFGRKLTQAGVDVMSVRINGTCHDFMVLNGLSETAPAKAAFALACKVLKKALHK